MKDTCVWCGQPGTLSESRPLAVHSFDTGESIETVRCHEDCDVFWTNCIFCKGNASPERPTVSHWPKNAALRFTYHQDCAENRVRTLYPDMFEKDKVWGGRSYAESWPDALRDRIVLIGEGIRIKQRAWMRLPVDEPTGATR